MSYDLDYDDMYLFLSRIHRENNGTPHRPFAFSVMMQWRETGVRQLPTPKSLWACNSESADAVVSNPSPSRTRLLMVLEKDIVGEWDSNAARSFGLSARGSSSEPSRFMCFWSGAWRPSIAAHPGSLKKTRIPHDAE